MKKYLLILTLFLIGCTDANLESISAYGETAEIFCYSGGKEIFRDASTGKIEMLSGGGWHYKSQKGFYVRTFADCFVEVKRK